MQRISEMDSSKRFIEGKKDAKALVLNDFYTQSNLNSNFKEGVSP